MVLNQMTVLTSYLVTFLSTSIIKSYLASEFQARSLTFINVGLFVNQALTSVSVLVCLLHQKVKVERVLFCKLKNRLTRNLKKGLRVDSHKLAKLMVFTVRHTSTIKI